MGSRSGSRSGEGSRFWSRSGVKVRGQCHGVKVRVMIGGHKVGQGRWSRSGYRSWGQVGGGVKVDGSGRGSRSGGHGLGRGQGLEGQGRGQGCSQGRGQGQGSRSWGQGQGHDWWSQGLGPRSGSMLGVKVRGVVKVMVRGSMPGG